MKHLTQSIQYLVLFGLIAFSHATQASHCGSQISTSECCAIKPHWSGSGTYVTQCGCEGFTYSECTDPSISEQCFWNLDSGKENDCAAESDLDGCNSYSYCNWIEDAYNNGTCVPLLCTDRPCSDITNYSECDNRPNCQWDSFYAECHHYDYNHCSCADPSDLHEFCPCQTSKEHCDDVSSCYWEYFSGCTDEPDGEVNAAAPGAKPTMAFLALVAILGFFGM